MLVAMLIEDALVDQSCVVVGPARTVSEGLAAAQQLAIDVAVLDVNVNGELSYPVADELHRRGIPFVFATGYGIAGLHARQDRPLILQKPFQEHELVAVLERALARSAPSA